MKPTRLFDLLEHQLNTYPKDDCLADKVDGQWQTIATNEVVRIVNELTLGLLSRGVDPGDKVALVSANRPEWNFVDLATQQIGAVLVPMYPNSTSSDYGYITEHSEAKVAFVSTQEIHDKFLSGLSTTSRDNCEVFTFDELKDAQHWKSLLAPGDQKMFSTLQELKSKVRPEDCFTIIYTSGTTGIPKGVMLSHSNVLSNVMAVNKRVYMMDSAARTLSFLPLCHIFARAVFFRDLFMGTSIYYAESMDKISENIKEVKPDYFCTVPRLLEKVFDKIMGKGLELKGVKKQIFFWALNLGLGYNPEEKISGFKSFQLKYARKLVFSKWQEALGGNLKLIVSGASALQARLVRVFWAADIKVIEGYGLTETSPAISFTRPEPDGVRAGWVGQLIDDVEVKIAEDGEILARGPNIMLGYYKDPEATRDVISDDGWFSTGDIGELSEDGFLRITDRKKELFKTSGGKYIAPQPMENNLKENLLVDQAMIVGSNRKFPSALIVPSFENLREWCRQHGIEYTNDAEMIQHQEIIRKFDVAVEEFNARYAQHEKIKKYGLLATPFTVDGNELTPTLKLKRRVILEKYASVIEEMYEKEAVLQE